ncbi:type IVB secretion system protein IcmH/DotU [Rosenbergiella nectarea]|uniref:type IVB secretion system protein IcmH/DotU n=1 Tax=Rosenbergiella nectarea TaxID=988801 RepID=UPI001BDAD1C2|nr:type IVB secretion system protein IcmH/DotU [Rosenbergiella nectarea]MBT0729782.1 OmpA family protein [Rosenbergiella nectarea subsp. apis]
MTKLETFSTTSLNEQGSAEYSLNTIDSELQSASLPKKHFVGESVAQRLSQARDNQHPLYCLAKPLLNVLSDIPLRVEHIDSVDILRSWLIYEVTLFSQLCEQLNIPWRKMTIARYCLCTALDEAIHTTEWGMSSGWSQQNLLNYFEEDNDGGNKFFLLAGRLAMNPTDYKDVLILMLHILNLGFEGRYSIQQDGKQQLTQIRQQLYTLLMPYLAGTKTAVFTDYRPPEWPIERGKFVSLRGGALLSLMLVAATYGAYRLQLNYRLSQLTHTAMQLSHHLSLAPMQHSVMTLPILLKTDIEQGRLTIEQVAEGYHVKVVDSAMFASGSTQLLAHHYSVIERIAQATQQLGGVVTLIGHSDSQPIRSKKNTSNQQLSLQRADEVARIFYRYGFTDSQLQRVGAGEHQPLTANLNLAQRNQNRRVEFFITL